MKCADLEILLCDYVDGMLSPSEKATVELHLAQCDTCSALVADAASAVLFIGRAAVVEPPAELVNGILHQAREAVSGKRRSGWRASFGRWLEPVLQPRFAMGMAMTILSFSMLGRFAGIPVRQLKPSDLEPAKLVATLDDKLHRAWERAVKYYQSMRLVYEIQNTLNEWGKEDEAATGAGAGGAASEGPIQPKAPPAKKQNSTSEGRASK